MGRRGAARGGARRTRILSCAGCSSPTSARCWAAGRTSWRCSSTRTTSAAPGAVALVTIVKMIPSALAGPFTSVLGDEVGTPRRHVRLRRHPGGADARGGRGDRHRRPRLDGLREQSVPSASSRPRSGRRTRRSCRARSHAAGARGGQRCDERDLERRRRSRTGDRSSRSRRVDRLSRLRAQRRVVRVVGLVGLRPAGARARGLDAQGQEPPRARGCRGVGNQSFVIAIYGS